MNTCNKYLHKILFNQSKQYCWDTVTTAWNVTCKIQNSSVSLPDYCFQRVLSKNGMKRSAIRRSDVIKKIKCVSNRVCHFKNVLFVILNLEYWWAINCRPKKIEHIFGTNKTVLNVYPSKKCVVSANCN